MKKTKEHHHHPSSRNPREEQQQAIPVGPPQPPSPPASAYSPFPDLERRTIVLYDGSVRSYFALPPEHLWPHPPPEDDDDGERRRARLRECVLRYGNPDSAPAEDGDLTVASAAVPAPGPAPKRVRRRDPREEEEGEGEGEREAKGSERAFLEITKAINENAVERRKYTEDGKGGPLHCIVCGRTSRAFTNVHDLILHAYTSPNSELRLDHLGLHKALCVLMGWDYTLTPDTSKAYQSLSASAAVANREDLIVWPPTVIIHNTNTGKKKDGRMDGLNNKDMETELKELGFTGGMPKSLYSKGGHLGITAVKFASTPTGLKEADSLVAHFEKDNRGREGWARVEAAHAGDDEKNPALVKVDEKTGERKRVFYCYLATAFDLEKVDIDTRKKAIIKSRRELDKLKNYS
ncbi:uncharacterized protein M6B38_363675 [Iris pallida]|uniref:XS domain-containing protein n=1 Tax=Iris pallida TaxID=29817 RepID=A0AAX6GHS3_IRIPA|nr:uncharacterized protein M6B38_363675 [Iris pallida]